MKPAGAMTFLLWALAPLPLLPQHQEAGKEAAKVTLPNSPDDIARGKKLYLGSCTYCHGPTGDGGKGADLSRPELSRAKTDGDLARIIEVGVPGTEMPAAWHMTRREVTQVAAFVRTLAKPEAGGTVTGDAARGRALYVKHGCGGCHTLKQRGEITTYQGGYMGPDLSSIGHKRNARHLREALIDPAATLPEGFVPTKITTAAGRTIQGVRLYEDTFSILIRDAGGNNHAVPKTQIKSIEKDRKSSPMPTYKDKLSGAELDDLVAYLASLKEPLQ